MASSGAVDNNLRKRLKRVEAIMDCTQAEIINLGLNLIEEKIAEKNFNHNPKARSIIENDLSRIDMEEWEIELLEKLSKKGSDRDELRFSLKALE